MMRLNEYEAVMEKITDITTGEEPNMEPASSRTSSGNQV